MPLGAVGSSRLGVNRILSDLTQEAFADKALQRRGIRVSKMFAEHRSSGDARLCKDGMPLGAVGKADWGLTIYYRILRRKHSIVFSIRQVMVIGPTPPGTGVITEALGSTAA